MTQTEACFDELRLLVDAQLDGVATDQQSARLEALVVDGPAARAAYQACIAEAVTLRALARGERSSFASHESPLLPVDELSTTTSPLDSLGEFGWLDQALNAAPRTLATTDPLAAPVGAKQHPRPKTAWDRLFADASWIDVAPAALCGALLVVVGILIGFKLGRQAAQPVSPEQLAANRTVDAWPREIHSPSPPRDNAGPAIAQPAPAADTPFATLAERGDCIWDWTTDPVPAFDANVHGRRIGAIPLHLLRGQATLTFDTGTAVELQGPALVAIESPSRIRLDVGTAVSHVPPPAVGFSIHTPRAEVVDLGTRFAVVVDATGSTDVHVLDGAVEIASNARPLARQRLVAGEARRLGAHEGGNWQTIVADRQSFAWSGLATQPPTAIETDPFWQTDPDWQRLWGDDFSAPTLDAARWQIVDAHSGGNGAGSLVPRDGQLALPDGTALVTVDSHDPAKEGLVRLRGRVTFATRAAVLRIVLRYDSRGGSSPNLLAGDGQQGEGAILLEANARSDALTISGLGKAQMRCSIEPGNTFDFEVLDDGRGIVFTMTEVGGDGTQAAVVRQIKPRGTGHQIVLADRAADSGNASRESIVLDRLMLEVKRAP